MPAWKRILLATWHLFREMTVKSGSSKVYHLSKAAYHAGKLLTSTKRRRKSARKKKRASR